MNSRHTRESRCPGDRILLDSGPRIVVRGKLRRNEASPLAKTDPVSRAVRRRPWALSRPGLTHGARGNGRLDPPRNSVRLRQRPSPSASTCLHLAGDTDTLRGVRLENRMVPMAVHPRRRDGRGQAFTEIERAQGKNHTPVGCERPKPVRDGLGVGGGAVRAFENHQRPPKGTSE